MQMEAEIEIMDQEQYSNGGLTGYQTLMEGITKKQWRKAEANQSLGYTGMSERTRQRHQAKIRKAQEGQNS